jgi:hypothetical protein
MPENVRQDTSYRIANVTEEPCVMLTPIKGFSDKPLVTLEEATAPLNTIVPHISTFVHVAKQCTKNPANNLSIDESASIALYTMEWEPYTNSLFYILNNALRTEDRQQLKPWFLYLKLLLTALSRLPSISVTVYCDLQTEIENAKYEIGNEVIWWGFSSCIKSGISKKDQAIGETGPKTLFIIDCMNGKDISKHSYFRKENEVLLLPATTVNVIKNEYQENDLHVIHLEEIESSFILLESVSSTEEIYLFKFQSIPYKISPLPKKAEKEVKERVKANKNIKERVKSLQIFRSFSNTKCDSR